MKFYHKLMREAAMWRRFWKRGHANAEKLMMSAYRQAQCWKWLWAKEA